VGQFADAFHRVLGVRGVRGVRARLAPKEAPNGPNAPNGQHAAREGRRTALLGDVDYLDFLAVRHHEGYLTTAEALEQERLHRLVLEANAA
jgi:hypothetical protein